MSGSNAVLRLPAPPMEQLLCGFARIGGAVRFVATIPPEQVLDLMAKGLEDIRYSVFKERLEADNRIVKP